MKSNINYFERITKLSIQERKSLINWFNKQNFEYQIEIMKEQRNQYFKLSTDLDSKVVHTIASFYLAIIKFYKLDKTGLTKNKTLRLNSLSTNVSFSDSKKYKKEKQKIKRDQLLNKWSVVKHLKEDAYSFREIQNYLRSKHRFEISHAYIQQVWREVEGD